MADDADVQASEITLDDFNADEVPAKADPSPVKEAKAPETPKVEKAETKEETKADDTAVEPEAEAKETEDKAEAEVEETKPTKADERKAQLNTEIRDLVAQRNALKSEVKKANDEAYQVATEDELVEQGLSATDAKVEALRQQIEMQNYNDQVADAQLTLQSQAERVLRDYPIFNSESEQYDKALSDEASAFVDSQLIKDPNTNQIIGSNVDIGKYYETLARASGLSTVKGQLKGQADTEKQLASVDAGGTATVPQKPKDSLMELWTSDD